MVRVCLLFCVVLCGLACSGWNELGGLAEARKNHAVVFEPGSVLEYEVAGEKGYVYNGQAERYFSGNASESESELYKEATLDAKNNLYKYLTKGDKSKTVQVTGARTIYQYAENQIRRVVCFVPAHSVQVGHGGDSRPLVLADAVAALAASKKKETSSAQPSKGVSQPAETPVEQKSADRLEVLLGKLEDNQGDWLLLDQIARLYARRGMLDQARAAYGELVNLVAEAEKIDKEPATDLLFEAAWFFEWLGDSKEARKCYRAFLGCESRRGWKMDEEVREANRKAEKSQAGGV